MTYDEVLRWYALQSQLRQVKSDEGSLRKSIANEILNGKFGTHHYELENLDISAVGKKSYKVDSEPLQAIWQDLSEAERASVKWEPKIVKSKFEKLPDTCRLASVVISKPAMPSLKVSGIGEAT